MKLLLTTIAAVLVVGCGESQQSTPAPESKPVEPVAEAATPEPPTAEAPDISIHDAAKAGNIEVVKLHLAAGTDVNTKDKSGLDVGMTLLHYAAGEGHKEITDLLLTNGANLNAKNDWGETPLHRADNKEIAELLITKGADVNAKNNRGGTLLHSAANKEIAELLIAEGADVNAKGNRNGGTPLSYAAGYGRKEVAELLITAGANLNAMDDNDRTPLDATNKYDWVDIKRTEIADLLRKHGGKTGEELKAGEK
jgi:ankyrin repeat protein